MNNSNTEGRNYVLFSGFPAHHFTIGNGKVDIIGIIHRIDKGAIGPFTEADVRVRGTASEYATG